MEWGTTAELAARKGLSLFLQRRMHLDPGCSIRGMSHIMLLGHA
jgi:hypothetical protein